MAATCGSPTTQFHIYSYSRRFRICTSGIKPVSQSMIGLDCVVFYVPANTV